MIENRPDPSSGRALEARAQLAAQDGLDQILMVPHLQEGLGEETLDALQRVESLDHDLLAVDDIHRRHEPRVSFSRAVVSPVGIEPTTT